MRRNALRTAAAGMAALATMAIATTPALAADDGPYVFDAAGSGQAVSIAVGLPQALADGLAPAVQQVPGVSHRGQRAADQPGLGACRARAAAGRREPRRPHGHRHGHVGDRIAAGPGRDADRHRAVRGHAVGHHGPARRRDPAGVHAAAAGRVHHRRGRSHLHRVVEDRGPRGQPGRGTRDPAGRGLRARDRRARPGHRHGHRPGPRPPRRPGAHAGPGRHHDNLGRAST